MLATPDESDDWSNGFAGPGLVPLRGRSWKEWTAERPRFVEMSDENALKYLGKEMQRMSRGFDRGMPRIDVAALERDWDIRMTRFEDLVKETGLLTSV
ncbi:MAG: hypothetical protein ACLQD9_01620 [Thermoplasmata archaeon]